MNAHKREWERGKAGDWRPVTRHSTVPNVPATSRLSSFQRGFSALLFAPSFALEGIRHQPPNDKGALASLLEPASALTPLPVIAVNSRHPRMKSAALRAKYEHGDSVADIAAQWGDTSKAVESVLTQARAAFREEYQRLEQE